MRSLKVHKNDLSLSLYSKTVDKKAKLAYSAKIYHFLRILMYLNKTYFWDSQGRLSRYPTNLYIKYDSAWSSYEVFNNQYMAIIVGSHSPEQGFGHFPRFLEGLYYPRGSI